MKSIIAEDLVKTYDKGDVGMIPQGSGSQHKEESNTFDPNQSIEEFLRS